MIRLLLLCALLILAASCTIPEGGTTFTADHCVVKHEGIHNTTLCMKSTNQTADDMIVGGLNS